MTRVTKVRNTMAIAGLKQERIWFGLLGRKVTANLDSIFKSRDITFPKEVCVVKAVIFPVVMYGCES